MPWNEPEQREHDAGKDVGAFGAAALANRLACPAHVIRVNGIADHLEREVRFHRRADVEIAVGKQRPAAVRSLNAAQIGRDLGFKRGVDRFPERVSQQHVLGRNGGVGLKLEHPMTVVALAL